jgi:hypothetical protein
MLTGMQVYVFFSGKDAEVCAITSDQTGGMLPSDLAPWHALGGQALPIGNGSAVCTIIAQEGYYLVRSPRHEGPSNRLRVN